MTATAAAADELVSYDPATGERVGSVRTTPPDEVGRSCIGRGMPSARGERSPSRRGAISSVPRPTR